jgi:hypothetical protein
VTPKQQLDSFLKKYDPEIARVARRAFVKMRKRLPGAAEIVYDNYNALAIGFGPNEKSSFAIFSVVLYPRWVSLFFLQGAKLPDPARRCKALRRRSKCPAERKYARRPRNPESDEDRALAGDSSD